MLFIVSVPKSSITNKSTFNKFSEKDESFNVKTSDDATIPVSFEMTYHFDESRIINTYKNVPIRTIIDKYEKNTSGQKSENCNPSLPYLCFLGRDTLPCHCYGGSCPEHG